jgi:hypothetical protein
MKLEQKVKIVVMRALGVAGVLGVIVMVVHVLEFVPEHQ